MVVGFQGNSHNHGLKRSGSQSWQGDGHKVSKYKHQAIPNTDGVDHGNTNGIPSKQINLHNASNTNHNENYIHGVSVPMRRSVFVLRLKIILVERCQFVAAFLCYDDTNEHHASLCGEYYSNNSSKFRDRNVSNLLYTSSTADFTRSRSDRVPLPK